MQIEIIRSNRRSISIQITKDERVLIRAPYHLSQKEINEVVQDKADWIARHLEKLRREAAVTQQHRELTPEEIAKLKQEAVRYIPDKVAYYAHRMQVTYGRITMRHQKTRWGSCSSKGNLNFNCLLMQAPEEVLDYVIVHELCHRKQMNHSKEFWEEVAKVLPDYQERKQWLKIHGSELNFVPLHPEA